MRETVLSETAMPSILSSPWIRGARQGGFSTVICTMSRRISAGMQGRPLLIPLALTGEPRTCGTARVAIGRQFRAERTSAHRASRSSVSPEHTRTGGQKRSTPVAVAYAEKREAGVGAPHSRSQSTGDHCTTRGRIETSTESWPACIWLFVLISIAVNRLTRTDYWRTTGVPAEASNAWSSQRRWRDDGVNDANWRTAVPPCLGELT
jgi:hypothetical protein